MGKRTLTTICVLAAVIGGKLVVFTKPPLWYLGVALFGLACLLPLACSMVAPEMWRGVKKNESGEST